MEESKTDFATFQEVADYLDSIMSDKEKSLLLAYGDRDRLGDLHLDFGIYLRNTFIFDNKSKLALANDCTRITQGRVVEDLSQDEMWVTEWSDVFGGELMELYYKWLKMIPPCELRDM